MPEEYLRCKESYMKKGVSEKTASARCAAMYYKRHGVTVNEAAKKAGEATTIDYDESLYKAILAEESEESKKNCGCKAQAIEHKGIYAKMQAISVNIEMIDDGIVEIVATRVGAKAYTSDGVALKWPKKTLENMSHTWTNGTVSINHDPAHIHGKIISAWFDGKNTRHVLKIDDFLSKWISVGAALGLGVSIEADELEYDEKKLDILNARGTGVTIVFPPATAACPPEEGCGIMGTEEQEYADGAKLTYEERQKLPDSAFCGPDRSFPAHDADHVRNGLARLSQSNYSSEEKASILKCLKSRAKKHGIEVSEAGAILNSADKDNLVMTIVNNIVVDEESARAEEAGVNSGETMADEDKTKIVAAELEKKTAELDATKKELEELRAFKEKIAAEEKTRMLAVVATYIDSKPFENEHLCSIKAVVSALETYKKKMDEEPERNSGAQATERTDPHQGTTPTYEGASPEEAKEFEETAREFEKKTGRKVY